ncbi:MAG: ATP-binding cassette domain-containing protein [Acidimicrobiaceae bacterium]|nr:ATP-binding cassette domain-containing protein [Acidimicrobiaceae bacterium]MBO0748056.1 ATP-binding cassette domain-containing protein [Acidimicrobiaceae bacterium]
MSELPTDRRKTPALVFSSVDLDRARGSEDNLRVLHGINWTVGSGERWAMLGPNGSGKTTIFQLASGYLHPTRGTVDIVGHRLGRVDVRALRERIGLVSASVAKMVVPTLRAIDVVVSARHGALEPWWHTYEGDEWELARKLLDEAGFGAIADRAFGVLSEGERQQVLLARSLMNEPALILLDEPAAGLDVGGREGLVGRLGRLAADPGAPPTVLITHHVEEIPVGFTHVLLLREGRVVAAGPLEEELNAETLSATFGLPLVVERAGGRWSCRAR